MKGILTSNTSPFDTYLYNSSYIISIPKLWPYIYCILICMDLWLLVFHIILMVYKKRRDHWYLNGIYCESLSITNQICGWETCSYLSIRQIFFIFPSKNDLFCNLNSKSRNKEASKERYNKQTIYKLLRILFLCFFLVFNVHISSDQ